MKTLLRKIWLKLYGFGPQWRDLPGRYPYIESKPTWLRRLTCSLVDHDTKPYHIYHEEIAASTLTHVCNRCGKANAIHTTP